MNYPIILQIHTEFGTMPSEIKRKEIVNSSLF
jgi:hypothetical protein